MQRVGPIHVPLWTPRPTVPNSTFRLATAITHSFTRTLTTAAVPDSSRRSQPFLSRFSATPRVVCNELDTADMLTHDHVLADRERHWPVSSRLPANHARMMVPYTHRAFSRETSRRSSPIFSQSEMQSGLSRLLGVLQPREGMTEETSRRAIELWLETTPPVLLPREETRC